MSFVSFNFLVRKQHSSESSTGFTPVFFKALWHSREKRLLTLSCPSACISPTPTGRIYMTFEFWDSYETVSGKPKFV